MEQQNKTNKRTAILAIVLLAVVAACVIFINNSRHSKNTNTNLPVVLKNPALQQPGQEEIAKLPDNFKQLPAGQSVVFWPANLPLEAGATMLQNYQQDVEAKQQGTKQFLSQKTLTENFELYKKYLSDNNWQVSATIDQAGIKYLSAQKDNIFFSITTTPYAGSKQTLVDLTLVTDNYSKKD